MWNLNVVAFINQIKRVIITAIGSYIGVAGEDCYDLCVVFDVLPLCFLA